MVISDEEEKQINKEVADMAVYRLGNVLINNTDSIYVTHFVGTAATGIFSNYQFVVMGVRSLVGAMYEAVRGKIGHSMQTADKETQYKDFILYY